MFTNSRLTLFGELLTIAVAMSLVVLVCAAQPQPAANADPPATVPPVALTKEHEKLCVVKVGDQMPEIELEQASGGQQKLAEMMGKTATVVVFWKADRRMSQQLLADLEPDVIEPFPQAGVAVVGVAVQESVGSVSTAMEHAAANFPNLLDTDGAAFALVGSEKLPRVYLLDSHGKILWFDLEYSNTTRRELHQALQAVTGGVGR